MYSYIITEQTFKNVFGYYFFVSCLNKFRYFQLTCYYQMLKQNPYDNRNTGYRSCLYN